MLLKLVSNERVSLVECVERVSLVKFSILIFVQKLWPRFFFTDRVTGRQTYSCAFHSKGIRFSL